jgi:hypothetical protein
MLDQNTSAVRAVAWSEVFPWLCIYRTFRLAIGFRMLLLGAVAALLTALLWGFFGYVFSENLSVAQWTRTDYECPWVTVTDLVKDKPSLPGVTSPAQAEVEVPEADMNAWHPQDPFFGPWWQLSRPLWGVFSAKATVSDLACLVLCGLSSLAIWAFFGGAISRIAAVQLAADERISLAAALRHACSKWVSYFSAPLFPLLGMALAAVPIWSLGFLLRANFGMLLVGLIWPVLLVLGLIMTLLLVGLLFGWPLMWGTISTEGTDSFDALSRSYAYVYQRPVHYLFYAAVAGVFGWFGWLLVKNFAAGVVWLTYWSASWGSGGDPIQQVLAHGGELGGLGYAGAMVIRFWAGCVKLLAVGFLFSYFWTAATAIYLLLRRNVDATEMDEVFLDADESEQAAAGPAPQAKPAAMQPPAEPPAGAKPADQSLPPPLPPTESGGSGIPPQRPPDEAT